MPEVVNRPDAVALGWAWEILGGGNWTIFIPRLFFSPHNIMCFIRPINQGIYSFGIGQVLLIWEKGTEPGLGQMWRGREHSPEVYGQRGILTSPCHRRAKEAIQNLAG